MSIKVELHLISLSFAIFFSITTHAFAACISIENAYSTGNDVNFTVTNNCGFGAEGRIKITRNGKFHAQIKTGCMRPGTSRQKHYTCQGGFENAHYVPYVVEVKKCSR